MTETKTAAPADPWGARPRDWAEIEDENARGLFERVLGELGVGEGARMLDAGCGSGLALSLAAERGARVAGLDASPGMLSVARERLPDADLREGDMQELPWPDGSFDAVTFFNCLFLVPDEARALREAGRVTRRGGQVAAVYWTEPERFEAGAYMAALAPLLPPLPVEVQPFREPAALERLASAAGLSAARVFEADWTWVYPDLDTLLRGWLSVGLTTVAIAAAGEDAVRAALARAAEPFRMTDGTYRLENACRCLVATR